jgi:phenylacetate-CoA ligase
LDSTVLLWGHSHLFGSGVKGQINEFKRRFLDWVVNINRLNAYDLSLATIENYFQKIREGDPVCIIGYTSSLFSISRYIIEQGIDFRPKAALQGIIVTSETVTENDIKIIQQAFRSRVIIEYGTAETSVIAYSLPGSDGLRVFWDSFIAQTDIDNQLMLTTIYNREFPLINYNTSDIVKPLTQAQESIFWIENVKGRARDNVRIRTLYGGALELSGILIVHILKGIHGIFSISYQQASNDAIDIFLVSDKKLDLKFLHTKFMKELSSEYRDFDSSAIRFHQIEQLPKTIAGKAKIKID